MGLSHKATVSVQTQLEILDSPQPQDRVIQLCSICVGSALRKAIPMWLDSISRVPVPQNLITSTELKNGSSCRMHSGRES